ncbi:methionyl-tRNA formyltransferase [Mucilaginibacter sp. PPCGB 2223]|nr:methionyl-tRNA formyltransferase [Mucilaginibacter sp. PPCGB 2223]
MRIGVITNTDTFIPFVYALVSQQISVHIYFSPSPDDFVNQKISAFAQQININVTQEKNPADLYSWLIKHNFDVCFMLGYKHLIRLDKLKTCPTPLFNIHFGTLPAYRGSTPVFWQLKHGQKIGVAIHKVSEKFDDGPIYWLKETDIQPHFNYEIANQVLGQICVEGVFYILSLLLNKMPLPVISGIGSRAYQQRPALKDVSIDWQQMPAAEICNLIRACNPWNKGALSIFNQQEVKLMDAQVINTVVSANTAPGTIINDENSLHITCCDGNVLNINMLFFSGFYLPAYQAKVFGFVKGQRLC